MDGKFASASYDDEGVPRRRNMLVEKGVLKGFIYDLKTAAQSGVESTGNAMSPAYWVMGVCAIGVATVLTIRETGKTALPV